MPPWVLSFFQPGQWRREPPRHLIAAAAAPLLRHSWRAASGIMYRYRCHRSVCPSACLSVCALYLRESGVVALFEGRPRLLSDLLSFEHCIPAASTRK